VERDLGRGHRKDQPSATRVDAGQTEHIAKEGAVGFSVVRENYDVRSENHGTSFHRGGELNCKSMKSNPSTAEHAEAQPLFEVRWASGAVRVAGSSARRQRSKGVSKAGASEKAQ
jgi:hypothetical protein